MFGFLKKKETQPKKKTHAPVLYAFGCYDGERVMGMALLKPEFFTKETICKSALPRALPQRMAVPAETVSLLCNFLEYFAPEEWGAPSVTVAPDNLTDGFRYDDALVKIKIEKHLAKLGHTSQEIELAYQMKVTVPFPNIGLFVIVVGMQR